VGCGKPFARHGARGRTGATEAESEGSPLAAYEWISTTYPGLSTPHRIESELTDEQLAGYLDAAQDRISAAAKTRFISAVEAVRVGTVVASDRKAASRWRSYVDRHTGHGAMNPQALEAQIMSLARRHPEYVVVN